MKNLIFLALIMPAISTPQVTLSDITKAISNGDVAALSGYFDQTVEIALQDQEEVYEKAEATGIIKRFFAQNKPKSFSQVHQGTSKGNDSQYCIGNLVTEDGTFRVYIYMRVEGNQYRIQELRFDRE